MLSRFSCLRCVLTNASKFITTRKSFPVSNLLLHTTNVNCWFEEFPTRPRNVPMRPKVAVLIGGCGGLDGTPAIEVMSLCAHMYQRGITPDLYSTNYKFVATPSDIYRERRNAKFEAARLVSFHPIYDLSYFSHHDYIGLAILGGGGILNLLSDVYADGWINTNFEHLIGELVALRKPIYCTSEAGLLLAMALERVEIAVGDKIMECPITGDDLPMWQVANNLQAEPIRNNIWIDRRYNVISIPGTSILRDGPSSLFISFIALVNNMVEQAGQLWPRVSQEAVEYHDREYHEPLVSPNRADNDRSNSSVRSFPSFHSDDNFNELENRGENRRSSPSSSRVSPFDPRSPVSPFDPRFRLSPNVSSDDSNQLENSGISFSSPRYARRPRPGVVGSRYTPSPVSDSSESFPGY